MKKRISLIFTFIISFVLLINNVNAAKELTCIYPHGNKQYAVIFVQDSNGNQTYYQNSEVSDLSDLNWEKIDVQKNHYKYKTTTYATYLPHCPPCLDYKQPNDTSDGKMRALFKGETKEDCRGFIINEYVELSKQEDRVMSEDELGGVIDKRNRNWDFTCIYGTSDANATYSQITLSYNKNNFEASFETTNPNVNSSNVQYEFTATELWKDNSNSCPNHLNLGYTSQSEITNLYLDKDTGVHYALISNTTDDEPTNPTPTPDLNKCQDLFSDDVINLINKAMNIIKLAVPILLIVLGITDFFRATFSDSEDNMKKDRDRFIKRIIAAIIIFIVPFFVNLVLKVANSVWSDINVETCTTKQK